MRRLLENSSGRGECENSSGRGEPTEDSSPRGGRGEEERGAGEISVRSGLSARASPSVRTISVSSTPACPWSRARALPLSGGRRAWTRRSNTDNDRLHGNSCGCKADRRRGCHIGSSLDTTPSAPARTHDHSANAQFSRLLCLVRSLMPAGTHGAPSGRQFEALKRGRRGPAGRPWSDSGERRRPAVPSSRRHLARANRRTCLDASVLHSSSGSAGGPTPWTSTGRNYAQFRSCTLFSVRLCVLCALCVRMERGKARGIQEEHSIGIP